jgi:hypothetical protein
MGKNLKWLLFLLLAATACAVETGPAFRISRTGSSAGRASLGQVDLSQSGYFLNQLGFAQGGTNAGTAVGAFDNLSPNTTTGDIVYFNGTHNVRLPIGIAGQFLAVSGGVPGWTAVSGTLRSVTLPFSGSATGDTGPVTGSAPNWTFTTPAGLTKLFGCGHGGGGGGGGGGPSSSLGGQGGGGAASQCFPIVVTASTAYAVTIGSGGNGGASGTAGATGGDTTFSSLLTFKGAPGGSSPSQCCTTFNQVWDLLTRYGYGVGGGGLGGRGYVDVGNIASQGQRSAFALGGAVFSAATSGGGGGAGDGAGGAGADGSTSNPGSAGTDGGGGGAGSGNATGAGTTGGQGGHGKMTLVWMQ